MPWEESCLPETAIPTLAVCRLTSWERMCIETKKSEIKFSATRPAFYLHLFSLASPLNLMEWLAGSFWAMEAENISHRYTNPSSEQSQHDLIAVPRTSQLIGSHCESGFCRPGSHGQAPVDWCWNSHTAWKSHWAGPGKRQWPGACAGAGEHRTLPTCAHPASDTRKQRLSQGTVLRCVERTHSASINLSVFPLPL